MQVTNIEYRQLGLTMRKQFETAHDVTVKRPLLLIAVTLDDAFVGYGEVQAFANHDYAAQNQVDALAWLDQVIPTLTPWQGDSLLALLAKLPVDGQFARAGLEMALWDAVGKKEQTSLADMLGTHTATVPTSIALGLAELTEVPIAQQHAYKRIKLKQNQLALAQLEKIVGMYPEQCFSLDFNASLADTPDRRAYLSRLRDLGIDLIEEPFVAGEPAEYQQLATELRPMRVSLDEHLNSLADVQAWLDATDGLAYTIKQGKLGGIQFAQQALQMIVAQGQFAWVGGMLASGLGRAVDAALASQLPLPQYPADISRRERYFVRDIVQADLIFAHGDVRVPTGPGIGVQLDWQAIRDQQIGDVVTYNLLQKP